MKVKSDTAQFNDFSHITLYGIEGSSHTTWFYNKTIWVIDNYIITLQAMLMDSYTALLTTKTEKFVTKTYLS